MENNNQNVNPGCWITFLFATMMWIFTLVYFNVFQGDNYLLYGTILSVSLPFWIKAANMYYKAGDPYSGHYYMVFGILFGGFVGFSYLALYLGHVFPLLAMDERIMGVMYLMGGVFILPTVPAFLYMNKVSLVTYVVLTIWLFVGGIYYFYYTSVVIYYLNL